MVLEVIVAFIVLLAGLGYKVKAPVGVVLLNPTVIEAE
jgi:hypothetical protein